MVSHVRVTLEAIDRLGDIINDKCSYKEILSSWARLISDPLIDGIDRRDNVDVEKQIHDK